jgi:hypothetical protein
VQLRSIRQHAARAQIVEYSAQRQRLQVDGAAQAIRPTGGAEDGDRPHGLGCLRTSPVVKEIRIDGMVKCGAVYWCYLVIAAD